MARRSRGVHFEVLLQGYARALLPRVVFRPLLPLEREHQNIFY
jgi:hypothetical protein